MRGCVFVGTPTLCEHLRYGGVLYTLFFVPGSLRSAELCLWCYCYCHLCCYFAGGHWASIGHVPPLQSHEGTAGPPACASVCIWTAPADTLPSCTQEPKHRASRWSVSCGAHSPRPVGNMRVLVESGRPLPHHLPPGVRPHIPMLRLPTWAGVCSFSR